MPRRAKKRKLKEAETVKLNNGKHKMNELYEAEKSGGSSVRETPQSNKLHLKDDVKLQEISSKPASFVVSANMTEYDKTEELYKKFQDLLNKLTPQNFHNVLDQIQNFNIDTNERLQGVVDLVFEKAVDEPNFSVAYATLCNRLALLEVPVTGSTKKDDFVNFRKLLITRCQFEFEKNLIDLQERNNKVKEIDECADPDKAKDLALDLEEYDRRLRIKSVGNIRFIGELYKQQMLTARIMERCLLNLLGTQNEEGLECLCILLTTVGKELESKGINLNRIFDKMKDLLHKKDGKINSRVRFLIQDVLDLQLSKWVPRREDPHLKIIDHVKKEAKDKQLNVQDLSPNTTETDEGGESCRNSVEFSDDNWCSEVEEKLREEKPYGQFGKFVGSELRQLPQRQAILLQEEIQNCIIRSKLSALEPSAY